MKTNYSYSRSYFLVDDMLTRNRTVAEWWLETTKKGLIDIVPYSHGDSFLYVCQKRQCLKDLRRRIFCCVLPILGTSWHYLECESDVEIKIR